MLCFFSGTDREGARIALNREVEKTSKNILSVVRITDASTVDDLRAALQGGGMFGEARVVVLDGTLVNEEMRDLVVSSLTALQESPETFFILEEKLDADTRKRIEKVAEKSERFDDKTKKKENNIFAIANALKRRNKRTLWISYHDELAKGAAPEAIHGVLFWGAKDIFMKSSAGESRERAKKLIATLAELPHEARRRGEDLEYALERFVLSGM